MVDVTFFQAESEEDKEVRDKMYFFRILVDQSLSSGSIKSITDWSTTTQKWLSDCDDLDPSLFDWAKNYPTDV